MKLPGQESPVRTDGNGQCTAPGLGEKLNEGFLFWYLQVTSALLATSQTLDSLLLLLGFTYFFQYAS